MDHTAAVDIAKLAPPVGVTAASFLGYQWSDIAYFLTAVYTALMIVHFIWTKWLRPKRDKRRARLAARRPRYNDWT